MDSCASLFPLPIPWAYQLAFAIIMVILAIFTVTANATLIHVLLKTKQTKSITNRLILLMNVSDICTGVVGYPCIAAVYLITTEGRRNCKFELVTQFTTLLFAYLSFCLLMGVAIDRYIRVTKLNRYNVYMNHSRMKVVLAAGCLLSISISIVSTVFASSFYLKIVLNASNLSSLSLVFIVYTLVAKRLRVHSGNINQHSTDINSQDIKQRKMLRSTKTVRILLGTLLVLYAPYNVVSVIWTYYRFYVNVNPGILLNILELLSYIFIFSNAGINAMIYCYGNSVTRKYVRDRLCRQQQLTDIDMDAIGTNPGSVLSPNEN